MSIAEAGVKTFATFLCKIARAARVIFSYSVVVKVLPIKFCGWLFYAAKSFFGVGKILVV